jgi:hypothetical protein
LKKEENTDHPLVVGITSKEEVKEEVKKDNKPNPTTK